MEKESDCEYGNRSATGLNAEKVNIDELQSLSEGYLNEDFAIKHTNQELEETSVISLAATSQQLADAPKPETSEESQNAPKNENAVKSSFGNVEETVDEICYGSQTLDTSLIRVNEPNAAAKQGDVVVIQSVIQLAPPNVDGFNENAASADLDSTLETTSVTEKQPTIAVIEDMDVTETVNFNDSLEIQLVAEEIPKSTNRQRRAEEMKCSIAKTVPPTSLGLLSQYGSDSDDDGQDSSESDTASVVVVPTTVNKSYRSQVIEIDSDTDTDSSETVSSAVESGDETEYLTKIAKVISKRIEEHDGDDDSDDDGNADYDGKDHKQRVRRKPPRVRGEMLLEELPPIQDLQISVPAEECIEFGRVHSIVDQLLLVSALPNSILLDLDTVLFLEQGKRVLGEVFDVLGQVADPLYCVRFNTNQQIHEKGINVGDVVYVAPKTDHTHYVILSSLTKMRGSDASWENDIEPPPRYLDYSDDEEEREARQELRKQRQRSNQESCGNDEDGDNEEDDNKGADSKKHVRKQIKTERNAETGRPRRERPNSSGRRNNDTNDNNYNRRHQRFDAHSPTPHNYQPHQHTGSWHSHYNQQYLQRPPPQHAYRSPYSGPYPYQRAMYNTTPPPPQRTQHFHPYMHRAPMATVHEQFAPPTGHSMPPPSFSMPPPQMTHPPHNMPTQQISQPPPVHSIPLSPQMIPPPQRPSIHSRSLMPQMTPPSFNISPQQMLQPPPLHSLSPQEISQPSPQMMQQCTNYVENPIAAQSPSQPQPRNSIEKSKEPAPPGAD